MAITRSLTLGSSGTGRSRQEADERDCSLYAGQREPAPFTAGEVAPHPLRSSGPEFSVVEILQPTASAKAATVSQHSYELHVPFDAGTP